MLASVPAVLELENPAGQSVSLAQFRGRAVLVIAFLMDDLPSQAQILQAEMLARRYPDDLTVLGVSGDRYAPAMHRDLLGAYARANDLQRTVLLRADDPVRDGTSALGTIDVTPVTFLVNRFGVIVRRVPGYQTAEQLHALVAPALPPRLSGVSGRADPLG